MKLRLLTQRLNAIETQLAVTTCERCYGVGNAGPFSAERPIPSPVCPVCGAVAYRQHIVDVPQATLDKILRPAPAIMELR